jgi:hypothetical protein
VPILLFLTVFCIVLMAFLASPAPISIEFSDIVLIGLTGFIGTISLAVTRFYKIYRIESNLLFAICLYLSYLLLSAMIGLLHGTPLLNVLRSVVPYLSFIPLLFIGFLPVQIVRPWSMGLILILIGLLQASFLINLYFTHSNQVNSTLGVLINRITLLDQRTTLPLLLALTILPIIFYFDNQFTGSKKLLLNALSICLILLGLCAGIITLTRAITLSIFFGWIVFIILFLHHQSHLNRFSLSSAFAKVSIYVFCFGIFLAIISFIPKIHILLTGLLSRFSPLATHNHSDYTNGRLYDEWIPALRTWIHSGILSFFFGMGAGTTFTVLSGEERTYIHNLSIYSLVYGGVYGLFTCLWLYITLFKTLIIRAFQSHKIIYLAFSALLASLFFYGQFFAVHKGLAFNVMLFLMIALALCQPIKEVKSS